MTFLFFAALGLGLLFVGSLVDWLCYQAHLRWLSARVKALEELPEFDY